MSQFAWMSYAPYALGLYVATLLSAVCGPVPTSPAERDSAQPVCEVEFAERAPCLRGAGGSATGERTRRGQGTAAAPAGGGAPDPDPSINVDVNGESPVPDCLAPEMQFLSVEIEAEADDGTEVNDEVWHEDGYAGSGLNRMGATGGESYDIGLRFRLPQVDQGDSFVYARLVLSGTGDGQVDSMATLRIVGIDQDGIAGFHNVRPSQLPKTESAVDWHISSNWPDPGGELSSGTPLLRHSPDISPIINEIVGRSGWGSGSQMYGKTLGVVIEDSESTGSNFLASEDFDESALPGSIAPVAPRLELYRTVRSTFLGKELLGRPTDHSVTLNAMSLLTLEMCVEYATTPGDYSHGTETSAQAGGTPFEIVLDGLSADTTYYYRMCYRRPGETSFRRGPARRFRTQRQPGGTFRFTIQSDSHAWERMRQAVSLELYRLALKNAVADEPDFHIDLGDTFLCEDYSGGDVLDFEDAVFRHIAQRPFHDLLCHSAPLFLVVGNHEGEQGWRLDGTPDNVAVWAANARKLFYPNPVPDGFYTGGTDDVPFVGLRESYYAFEWGDALFVMLDPYWYTTTKPHDAGATPGSGDNWDWTLGFEQYDWLRQTLQNSSATFKFVFSHQVTGGADPYGRGGVEAASHALGGHGSYEWGGEDLSGADVFDSMRPGWGVPIHELLVDNNATIFFHGHDHVFVRQELDGVVYQECPQPSDTMYGSGLFSYLYGYLVNNSGHLRVTVSPAQVTVEYVRAYLPGDGPHGMVAYSYTIAARQR